MRTHTGTLLTATLLFWAFTAVSQDPHCKGFRKGDPNCFKKPTPTPTESAKGTAVSKRLVYNLSLSRVNGGDVVEFTPVDVLWTLSVAELGIAGPSPTPVDVEICPAIMPPPPDSDNVCARVAKAAEGKTYHGRMTVPAPPAGQQSPLKIVVVKKPDDLRGEDYGQREVVGDSSLPIDAAARYDAATTSFEVLTTRSTVKDTVWISLQALIKAVPPHFSDSADACRTVGFTTWCVFNQSYGNAGDGLHPVPNVAYGPPNVRVGPYDLVPERETDSRLAFDLDNHDHNPAAEIFVAVANGFSKAGMIVLSAYSAESGIAGGGSVAGQLDAAMEQMHSSMAASCDGQVAADVVILTNRTIANQSQFTLDALTRGTGVFTNSAPEIYRNIDGDLRCDRRGGAYKVSYAIYRTSWRAWGFQPTFQ